MEEYVNGDNDLAVCVDLDDQKWEENFMDNLVQEEIADTTEEVSDVDEEFDISLSSPKIKRYIQRGNTIIRGESDLFR